MGYRYRLYEKSSAGFASFKIAAWIVGVLLVLAVVAGAFGWRTYHLGIRPVGGSGTVEITLEEGNSLSSIAKTLESKKVIRSAKVFEYYARFHQASRYLQAGTYNISPSQSVAEIIAQLTHGKVATSLVTILPGQRLDQIRQSLINQGFSESTVDAALDAAAHATHPALQGKPAEANLEGYLYPDSFQRAKTTTAKDIVKQSLDQMAQKLTPSVRQGFNNQKLSVYQGITIASIVEKEVLNQSDRAQAAQVFIKRLSVGMPLGSDVTAYYGSVLAGRGKDVTYDTPYNTRLHTGLTPTPISNVSESSLDAVAHPATTDWLFFVSGDNGTTYFSKTVEEHEALAAKYCHKLCQE